jgi:gliding motility-associated-like protein
MKQFYMRNLFIGLLLLFGFQLQAADYYWVGGAGSWSDLNHWSTTSGGAPNQSLIPNLNDDVHFDALSGLLNNTNLDLPISSPAYCRNMTWTGVTAAVNFMYRGQPLNVYGNVELAASVRYGTQGINFVGTGAATLKMNGAGRYPAAGWYNSIALNKPGGSLTLLDGIPLALAVSTITLTAGSLDMSGFTHEFSNLASNNNNVRSLNINNATLNLLDTWDYRGTNNTINTTNSSIKALLFHSDRFSFPKVNVTAPNSFAMVINGTTFGELTFTSTTGAANQLRIGANNTIDRLEFKSGGAITGGGNVIKDLFIAPSNPGLYFSGNNTVTGTLHANTPDCDALALIVGTAGATITFAPGAAADVRNVNMSNMTAAGSITLPITVTGADGGGNSGWDFQPRATGTTMYWVGGAGDWNDKIHWSASSGGVGGYCVPFTGDNVVFDANSGFTAGNNTVTATSGNAWCHNMTWTNLTSAPVFNNTGKFLYIYGSLVLDPTLTLNGSFTLRGMEAGTLTANGFNLGTPVFRMERTGANGGITFTDNFTHPGFRIFHNSGKLLMPNRTLLLNQISVETSGVRTMDISNSTITLEQEWLSNSTNMTWLNNGAGSFIIAKSRFIANGLTFPKVHCAGAGDNFAIANATIQELLFSNTTLVPDLYALNGNNNIGTLEFMGAGRIRGNNTINNLLLAPSRNYYFQNIQTINGLFRYNNPDCSGLGEMKSLSGTATLNFGPSSSRDFNNVYLQNMAATGNGVPISVTGADAGGNTGFNITPSGGGSRYWVGGSGDWNQSAHWSTTSGGPGGACIPTVANDVFFDANSFSSGSSAVTISAGNAYCRNMNWTGAAFAPVFTKPDALSMEIWGNIILNPAVTMNARVIFTGATNSTFTSNGSTSGNLDMYVLKSEGYTLRFMDNYSNGLTRLELRNGGLDLSGRTIVMEAISDKGVPTPTSMNITNANINAQWEYQGAAKSLQAAGSSIVASWFATNGGTYHKLDITAVTASYIAISGTTIAELTFSNNSGASGARIQANNTIDRLEFKGRGYIGGTGNTIGTLIFAPGKVYTFLESSNTTITGDWFGSGTPCNPTQIVSTNTNVNATVTKTTGTVDFDYVRLNRITAAGVTPFKAREHAVDLTGNLNWAFSPYDNSATITGFGPDRTICADAFPVVLNTDGFFAGPSATYLWTGGSTGKILSVSDAGTYSVTVLYPDGCTISDAITITKSTVTVAPVTGSTTVCTGATITLQSATAGGVWSTSDPAIATINQNTGLITGIAPGTATITYTVTNANSCSASKEAIVTVNPLPVVNAITGTLTLFESGTTTLSSSTAGGAWSSSNPAVATVNSSGLVTGVAAGTANIIYTVTNANGCSAASTATVTVDGFSPAKRELSIVKTADAQEPSGNGGFTISLPSGIFATEDISVAYTVGGTAGAADYTPLSGRATISAGQNSISLPVTVTDDTFIENTETVLVTLSAGTSVSYTYTLSSTNGNATANITDDEDTPDKRVLSVTSAGNASEIGTQGKFRISLPATLLASEDITVNYAVNGTAINGTDYSTLSGSVVIPAGQNGTNVSITAIDDKIIEGNESVILTLTGGSSATTGNFTASATQGSATVSLIDDDFAVANRVLSVSAVVHAAEGGANGSFSIGLQAGYTATEAITVNYSLSGTATNGVDYTTLNGSALIPAGQNNVTVPVTVTDDTFLESAETVILTINNGSSATFTFTASSTAGTGTLNIADNDNTAANRVLSIIKLNDAAEPATSGAFSISLPSGVLASENITVNYTVSGTAAAGTDYIAIPATATIPAGQNSVQVPLNVIDDSIIERNETVTINLTGGTSANLSYTPAAGSSSATANIADNDFTANSNIVLLTKVSDAIEGGTNGQYRISLPPGVTSSENVTVSFSMAGTANGADYTLSGLSAGNIVIPAGANEVLIDVDAINDGIIEGPETVVLTLDAATSPSGPFTIAPAGNGAVVTIVDVNASSSTALQVIAGTNGSEPANGATFTVKLAGALTAAWPVTVGYTLSGSATSGIDYQNIGTVTIPANTNSVTVNLNVLDDKVIEPTETVHFTLLSGSATDGGGNAFIFPPDPANNNITVNITDNDASIAANRVLKVTPTADGAEPNANGAYTLSLPAGYTSAAPITFSYVMTGTAVRNTDYAVSTVTLPAYQNSVIIPLTVTDDQMIENTETAILTLDAAAGTDGNGFAYSRDAATYQATLNITDNDQTPANLVVRVWKDRDGAEGGTSARFNFGFLPGITVSEIVKVNYTISGTAVKGLDYNGLTGAHLTGTINLSAGGAGNATIASIVDDQIIEGTEHIVLTITSASSGSFAFTIDPAEGSAKAEIADNDDLPVNRVLSVRKTTDAAEAATNGLFTISLPAGVTAAADLTVNYTLSGTATAGLDYANIGSAVVIPAGQNSITVAVPVMDDQLIETIETVVLKITDGDAAGIAFTASTTEGEASLNILDNDNVAGNLIVGIATTTNASEPGTNGSFTLSLPAGYTASEDITVTYTIGGTATAGSDYTALSGNVVIPAGQTSVPVTLAVTDDNIIEPAETVVMTITGATSSNFTLLPGTSIGSGTVLINDNENNIPANKVLSIVKAADAAEPGTNGGFIIGLPVGISAAEDITVNYTVDGTANPGTDYGVLSGSVTIPAGQNKVSVPVTVNNDQLIELTETVRLTLNGGSSANFSFSGTGTATVNIADDESLTGLSLAIRKTADAGEPGTNGSFMVSLPTGILPAEAVTVHYTINGTATPGADYTALPGSVIIPAGQNSVNIPVAVINDQAIESTETLILTLTGGSSTSFTFSGTGSATANITDDESTIPANLALSIAKDRDGEEQGVYGGFIISLPSGIKAAEAITVNFTVAGSATANADYLAFSGSTVIPAGQNSIQLPVAVLDDQIIEGTETVIVTLNGGNSASLTYTGTGSATVNLADDDHTPENLVLSIAKTTDAAEPGTNGGFTISLPAGVIAAEDVTVNYSVSGTASAGTDYVALSGAAILPAGQNTVAIPLIVMDDNIYETPETLSLTLTGGTSAGLSFTASGTGATATANITDNDKMDQVITFSALPVKTLGDPAFILSATGGASGNPVTFTSSNPAVATVSGNTITIIGIGTASITASQAGNAIYHAAADVTQGIKVTFLPNTAPTLATIADQQVCFNTTMQTVALTGITAGTEQNQSTTLTVSSNHPGLFSALTVTPLTGGNAILNYTLNHSAGGTALITVTVKDNGGTLNGGTDTFSRTFTLLASALPQLYVEATPGTSVSKGQTLELRASGATSYNWANASGIIRGQNSATLTIRPAQNTIYTVTGTNALGCISTQSITITVNEDYNLVANNVLTPNGDGKNDFFVIQNIDMYPNNEVRIFDRAGRAIYSKKGYNNDWDGTINGTPLHEETYYYIINLGKDVKPKRGFISIVRKY